MKSRIEINNLQVDKDFYKFINEEVLSECSISESYFWNNFSRIIYDLSPINKDLINKREDIQSKINDWHKQND